MNKNLQIKIDKMNVKVEEMATKAKQILLDMIRNSKLEEIPIYEIYDLGFNRYDFFGCDNNGYGICYSVDYITNQNNVINFEMADADEYNQEIRRIDDFNLIELLWLIDAIDFYLNKN